MAFLANVVQYYENFEHQLRLYKVIVKVWQQPFLRHSVHLMTGNTSFPVCEANTHIKISDDIC